MAFPDWHFTEQRSAMDATEHRLCGRAIDSSYKVINPAVITAKGGMYLLHIGEKAAHAA